MGSQIREVLKDPQFEKSLTKLKLRAWQVFKWFCANFLGNAKSRFFRQELKICLRLTEKSVPHVPHNAFSALSLKRLSRKL